MPRKLLLSWRARERRWRKKYRGHTFNYPAKHLSKEESYRKALIAFDEWRKKIDGIETPHQQEWEIWIRAFAEGLREAEEKQDPWEWRRLKALFDRFVSYREQNIQNPLLPPSYGSKPPAPLEPDEPWKELPERKPANGTAPPETLKQAIDRFLADAQSRVGKALSHNRYANVRQSLTHVKSVLDCSIPLPEVGSGEVTAYNQALRESGLADRTCNCRQADFWQLLRHCCEEQWISALPPNVGSRRLAFKVKPKKIETVSEQDLRKILATQEARVKLWALLALNCGMTQVDLSELKHSEVDWEHGRIRRKRSKTAEHESTPEIDYLLWPETFALLKEQRSEHPELVLTSVRGNPLIREGVSATGKVSHYDTVTEVWPRAMAALGFTAEDRPLFKLLRKTAASKLNSHAEHARFARPFLGRSPQGIDERHYLAVDQTGFDRAVEWLGEWVRSLL